MIIIINITGDGIVNGAGEYEKGSPVALTASPHSGNIFNGWYVAGELKSSSAKYEFIAGMENISFDVKFFTTIENYLSGLVGFDIPDIVFNSIRQKRGISYNQDISTISTKTLRLAYADLLMWIVNSPSSVGSIKDSDGGWSHQTASTILSNNDKAFLRKQANMIYGEYGDSLYSSNIKIFHLNGKPIRRCR